VREVGGRATEALTGAGGETESLGFDRPCIPATGETSAPGNAFWSGSHPLPTNPKIVCLCHRADCRMHQLDAFTTNITTAPVSYYCSQGRHCLQCFTSAINASAAQLAAFKAAAAAARDSLSPGSRRRCRGATTAAIVATTSWS
jgi:hypothetical protein